MPVKTKIPDGWTQVELAGEKIVMPATVYARLDKRVERGTKWLDKKLPEWFENINLDSLQLSSEQYCICGQLFMNGFSEKVFKNYEDMSGYSGYARVSSIVGEKWLERHGFVDTGTPEWYHDKEEKSYTDYKFYGSLVYEWLTLMWADAIQKRK